MCQNVTWSNPRPSKLLLGIRRQPLRPRQLVRGLFDIGGGVVAEEAPFAIARFKSRQQRLHQAVTRFPGGWLAAPPSAQIGEILTKSKNILSIGDPAVPGNPSG